MRLLLVEDHAELAEWVARSLRQGGFVLDVLNRGDHADQALRTESYDLVILDLSLPGMDGLEVLRRLRGRESGPDKSAPTPVLVLTARNRTEERIAGLDAGADDYLGKPFDLAEVEARLRALVRRTQGTDDLVQVGELQLDRRARRLGRAGQPMDLPAREFEVLWELMTPVGRVVSKRELSDKLSELDEALGDNALEAFISRLRKKLQGSGAHIRTLRGLGYVLEAGVDRAS